MIDQNAMEVSFDEMTAVRIRDGMKLRAVLAPIGTKPCGGGAL